MFSSTPQKSSERSRESSKEAIRANLEEHTSEENAEQEASDAVARTIEADETARARDDDKVAEDSATLAKGVSVIETWRAELEATRLEASLYPPEKKQKPILFKDAVGRKFSFPFHLCKTWNVSLPHSSNPEILSLEWSIDSPL